MFDLNSIQELFNNFMAAPLEQQAIMGLGTLVALGISRSVWQLIGPVRWVLATAMVIGARIVHNRSGNPPIFQGFNIRGLFGRGERQEPVFDVTTKRRHRETVRNFAKSTKLAESLTLNQLKLIRDAAEAYGVSKKLFMDPVNDAYADAVAAQKVQGMVSRATDDSPVAKTDRRVAQPSTNDEYQYRNY